MAGRKADTQIPKLVGQTLDGGLRKTPLPHIAVILFILRAI